jgi:phosphoribosylformimino-5-aminoimidazole carboxamide ribotide isomerase
VEIIPAIDLRGGCVVRLAQGDYARETAYPVEPLALAQQYADAGAAWLHVVDLDGARSGELENLRVIEAIAKTRLGIQAGGGVREAGDLRRLFDAGVTRVVVGSIAVRAPQVVETWLAEFGAERLCIALDTRQDEGGRWSLQVKGWTEASPADLDELAPRYARAGARHLLCTDIARDGMLSGPNLDLYTHLLRVASGIGVQASGGVRDADDLRALRERGAAGAILGRSLLEGRMTLREALRC